MLDNLNLTPVYIYIYFYWNIELHWILSDSVWFVKRYFVYIGSSGLFSKCCYSELLNILISSTLKNTVFRELSHLELVKAVLYHFNLNLGC